MTQGAYRYDIRFHTSSATARGTLSSNAVYNIRAIAYRSQAQYWTRPSTAYAAMSGVATLRTTIHLLLTYLHRCLGNDSRLPLVRLCRIPRSRRDMSTDTLTAILCTPPRPSWSEVTWKVHATLVDLPYDESMNKCIYTVSPKNVHFLFF